LQEAIPSARLSGAPTETKAVRMSWIDRCESVGEQPQISTICNQFKNNQKTRKTSLTYGQGAI